MPIGQTVWSLDKRKELGAADLINEKELEDLLCDHIEILNRDWMVVNRQVKTDAGKFIDLLCIDRDGDMVVVELKKDMTPREVTAQVIDYAASVSEMTVEEIAQQYLLFSGGNETLNEAFAKRFNTSLEEDSVNENVKMTIVASKMDSSTERIIKFLREVYEVDINILFFNIFRSGEERIISHAWFQEDIEEARATTLSRKGKWNGEYYASFGVYAHRFWSDAQKYGFISAGRGSWYTKTLALLSAGDRVWVNIPQTGYVGVGTVIDESKKAKDQTFIVDGKEISMKKLDLEGDYFIDENDDELAEYVVKVEWIKTVDIKDAVREAGFFGNQNTICRPTTEKWNFTVERLKKHWDID